jgi:Leucine-rich repeat (LRR) protein
MYVMKPSILVSFLNFANDLDIPLLKKDIYSQFSDALQINSKEFDMKKILETLLPFREEFISFLHVDQLERLLKEHKLIDKFISESSIADSLFEAKNFCQNFVIARKEFGPTTNDDNNFSKNIDLVLTNPSKDCQLVLNKLWDQVNDPETFVRIKVLSSYSYSSITLLPNLPWLFGLEIYGNGLMDINWLVQYRRLKYLGLRGHKITKFESLKNLIYLEALDLSDNYSNDISSLRDLVHLKTLKLHNLDCNDITPLVALTSLLWLDLSDCSIKDISSLSQLKQLTYLNIKNNDVSDLKPLKHLHQLNSLDISGNNIQDISPLQLLSGLEYLDISENSIGNLYVLRNLVSLSTLKMAKIGIPNLDVLTSMSRLRKVDISRNKIGDLGSLSNLVGLELLNLDDNTITDLEPLSKLTELKELHIRNNRIQRLDPLIRCAALTVVTLHGNPLIHLAPLRYLHNLIWIHSDLTPLISNLKYWKHVDHQSVILHREDVFTHGRRQILEKKPTDLLHGRLITFTFIGEEALDYGGPRKEFIHLFTEQVFGAHPRNPKLFELDNQGLWYFSTSQKTYNYEYVGRVLGFALANDIPMGIEFKSIFYKLILNPDAEVSFNDFLLFDLGLAKNYAQILSLSEQQMDDLTLTFSINNGPLLTNISASEPVTVMNRKTFIL